MTTLKSPFRYPGGKSRLISNISELIRTRVGSLDDKIFIDVFAGGGSVSLHILQNSSAHVVMNDLDEWMYSFWQSMTDKKETERLLSYINKYSNPTVDDFNSLRKSIERKGMMIGYKGFLGLFFNRTAFSGIFRSGPIGGYGQNGQYKIGCRYKPEKLKKTLRGLNELFEERKVAVTNNDFRDHIIAANNSFNVLYLDPPYMKQGDELYNHSMEYEDYKDMADLLKKSNAKWILSHDDYIPFVELFDGWADIIRIDGFAYTINSIEGNRKTELLICKKGMVVEEKDLKNKYFNV